VRNFQILIVCVVQICKQTNKRTPPKASNVLRYATTLGKQTSNTLETKTSSTVWSQVCSARNQQPSSVLAMVRRNFRRLNVNGFLKDLILNRLLGVQAWSLFLQKDIQCLERVQRAATKLVKSLKKLPFEERLNILGITTLYQRRISGDLIETCKILTGKVNVASDNFITPHTGSYNTRGHSK